MNKKLIKIDYKILPLKQLRETTGNPQKMTPRELQDLSNSMKTKGWVLDSPTVWLRPDGEYQIISGHHRVMAAIEAGIIETGCKVVEGLTEEQAKKFVLEANQRRGNFDSIELERFIYDILELNNDNTLEDIYKDIGVFDEVDQFTDTYVDEIANNKKLQPENDQLSITIKFNDIKEKEEYIEILDRIGGRGRSTEKKIKQFVLITLKNMLIDDLKNDKEQG